MNESDHTAILNGLSIDVEDYFHVSNFEHLIKNWDDFELRVGNNTSRILDILDQYDIKATFFILGWVAEKIPDLVKEISRRNHEIASHGYNHKLIFNLTQKEFREDVSKTKKILETISGQEVIGYRAPSYSITKKSFWALSILNECGYKYDSSIFPIHHHRYGIPDFNRFQTKVSLENNTSINELPISTVRLFSKNIPVSGGAYTRLFPLKFIDYALNRINSREKKPFIFYFHPWEIDKDQPRIPCSLFTKIRHYGNLGKMEKKLKYLFENYKFVPLKELQV